MNELFLCSDRAHYKRQASDTEGQQQEGGDSQGYVMSDHQREQIADQMRKVRLQGNAQVKVEGAAHISL